jgi:hypothetical protein
MELVILSFVFCSITAALAYVMSQRQAALVKELFTVQRDMVNNTLLAIQARSTKELSDALELAADAKLKRAAIQDELIKFNAKAVEDEKNYGLHSAPTLVTDIDGNQYDMRDLEVLW